MWAVAAYALAVPTFGLVVLLSPVGIGLSAVAWRRAPHDGVFWVGLTLNALTFVGLAIVVIGVFTGEVGIGLD